METQTPANARSRIWAGELAGAASTCALMGIACCLLGVMGSMLLERSWPVAWAVGLVMSLGSLGLVYLVAPLIGISACVGLLGRRCCIGKLTDSSLLRRTGWSFGRAAILFALTGSGGVLLIHTIGAPVREGDWIRWLFYTAVTITPLLAAAMGGVALRFLAPSPWSMPGCILAALAIAIGVAGVVPWAVTGHVGPRSARKEFVKPPTFAGKSDQLKQTVIVPTLDTPCPPGKNVIWCSSFQLAWNELRDNVIRAPLEVIGAEEIAGRLNEAKQSAGDLKPRSYYAVGGWVEDGIVPKIQRDMAAKFPSHALPDFSNCTGGILAYSYLTAHVPFKYPFRQMDRRFDFADSGGVRTNVEGFGVWEGYPNRYKHMRGQVRILYMQYEDNRPPELKEYAIDLCRHSEPYQVVVAVVEPKGSLAETVEYLRGRMAGFEIDQFEAIDILLVPELSWKIDHRFLELIGKLVASVGMPIEEAWQTIEFRLDRSGAAVESEAVLSIKKIPREFIFNRPFLIYMQKRDAEHPFFVLWVDNAELLVRK